ncbi:MULTISPECIES: S4 domain-containing protein [Chromobacterium]|uniref:Dual-specificity RNA pseudouridine synthase RluF n=1 Tax=Chromobacterium rhizoryzae TaxID=1778675 RepID=A0AAD0RTG0_9NEIS|nr:MULTISPECIES: S4 domain-containing protein [Chromobacterium]AXT48202.1 pseudouridylate synthase [Chromobacterium rhizoryzae]PTU71877.1 pseudouridylate synthase [Chromobacterium haemolyticum]QOD82161.1 pseudouridylate synthase [Chromobacterium haemolyticum]
MSDAAIRLSKRMVELGLCTRREADACIEQGLVKVDGQTVTALGSRVEPQQRVELMGRPDAQREAAVTLLLHKPAGAEPLALLGPDSQLPGDISGLSWLPRHRQHLQGFGAIADHAHGLVALTQDRKLAQRLADCQLEFLINVDAAPSAGDLQQRQKGLRPGGKPLRDLKVSRQSDRQLRLVLAARDACWLDDICAGLGVSPLALRCIRIGRLAIGQLAAGQWRYVPDFERF